VGTERDFQLQDGLVWFSADEVRALEQKYSAVYNLRGYVRIAVDYLFTDVERRNPSHRKRAIIAFVQSKIAEHGNVKGDGQTRQAVSARHNGRPSIADGDAWRSEKKSASIRKSQLTIAPFIHKMLAIAGLSCDRGSWESYLMVVRTLNNASNLEENDNG
jgi:hypothetical protein